jgi:hypothetical protein
MTRPLAITWIMRCWIPKKREDLHLVRGARGSRRGGRVKGYEVHPKSN